jgi:hypothetical protein
MMRAGSTRVALVLAFAMATPPLGSAAAAAEDPGPEKKRAEKSLHVSLGSGVFLPWDGNRGHNVSLTVHKGFGSDRFWVGGEFEWRHFEAEVKQDFRPDYNSFALRFQFQYHPFPKAVVSPYLGIAVGVMLNKVDDNHSHIDPTDKVRSDLSAGMTLLGLAGLEVPVPLLDRLRLFGEARVGNASDIWKRKGGNYQMDQIGGFTGMGGLRLRF